EKSVLSMFFQAEDGIRAFHVTGVQTCALPISGATGRLSVRGGLSHRAASAVPARRDSPPRTESLPVAPAPHQKPARARPAQLYRDRKSVAQGQSVSSYRGHISKLTSTADAIPR